MLKCLLYDPVNVLLLQDIGILDIPCSFNGPDELLPFGVYDIEKE